MDFNTSFTNCKHAVGHFKMNDFASGKTFVLHRWINVVSEPDEAEKQAY